MIKKISSILFALLFVVLICPPFYIRVKIDCKSQYGTCPNDILSKLSALNGKSLVSAKSNVSKILKPDFEVAQYSTQFKLPNILQVNIIVKKPDFAILNGATGKYYLIDSKGTILSISDESTLPTIAEDGLDLKPGQTINDNDLFALKLIRGIFIMYQVKSGRVDNNSLVVDMPGAVKVIFPMGDSDVDVLLGSLRLIYTKVTTDFQGKYSEIDMRYKNPILK